MIIDFTVENYLSFKDMQTLSLVAQPPYDHHANHILDTPDDKLKLLKSVVIYGANASGKSNLLSALGFFRHIVLYSNKNSVNDKFPLFPFLLDKENKQLTTIFEINFFCNNIRYNYYLSLDKERIFYESLSSYPKKYKRNVFTREFTGDDYEYSFGSELKPKRFYNDIANKTLKNVLFLSKAVNENCQTLTPVYQWFFQNLAEQSTVNDVAEKIYNDTSYKSNLVKFLNDQDINIMDLVIDRKNMIDEVLETSDIPIEIKEKLIEEYEKRGDNFLYKIQTAHQDSDGDVIYFDFGLESQGTQRLFALSSLIAPSIDSKVFYIDEIDEDLHPLLVQSFMNKFQKSNNQLICVTHDTHLIHQDNLRKDQIYFVEKDYQQASRLYSLLEFKARNDRENWEHRYLSGRYGATPAIFD